jgi:hypothetical protein
VKVRGFEYHSAMAGEGEADDKVQALSLPSQETYPAL